jgi:hypothetical protein
MDKVVTFLLSVVGDTGMVVVVVVVEKGLVASPLPLELLLPAVLDEKCA